MKSIKKWIAAAAAVCMAVGFTACGQEDAPETHRDEGVTNQVEDNGMETVHCLVQVDEYYSNELNERHAFTYDTSGNLVNYVRSYCSSESVWDEEAGMYLSVRREFDGLADEECRYSYDRNGCVTQAQHIEYKEDGSVERDDIRDYRYYFHENGEIDYVVYTPDFELYSPLNYYFTYENGNIVNVDVYRSKDGESFGDVVENYQYEYDVEGRLSGERAYFVQSGTQYTYDYIYDADGQLKEIDYYTNEDGEETNRLHEFTRDTQRLIIAHSILEEDGSAFADYLYYDNDGAPVRMDLYCDASKCSVTYDDNGNLKMACAGLGNLDNRIEYTYKAIEMTHEEAARYRRQQQMQQTVRHGWYTDAYYPVFYYHLIPNSVW